MRNVGFRGGALWGALMLVWVAAAVAGCGSGGAASNGSDTVVQQPPPVVTDDPPPVIDDDPPVVVEDPPVVDPPVIDPPAQPPALSPEAQALMDYWTMERFNHTEGGPILLDDEYVWTRLKKAQADECFVGVGLPYADPPVDGVCLNGGQPKVNDSYIWGMTLQNDKIFFGTLANTLCSVEAGYLQQTSPILTDEYVCEFSSSVKKTDGRYPNMFVYDIATGTLDPLNPATTNTAADALRKSTGGFRSAGSLNGVAFIAGTGNGINVFAFDADTNALITGNGFKIGGSACATAADPQPPSCPSGKLVYNNVRQWATLDGHLYLGVGWQSDPVPQWDPELARTVTTWTNTGGAVLKWTGDKDSPYQFVDVGHLPADAANMIGHTDHRLYITTWPSRAKNHPLDAPESAKDMPAGLYRSPIAVDPDGLTTLNVSDPDWSIPLWLATSDGTLEHANVPTYDPDRMGGLHTGGGALASYHGKVYFGTMTVPMNGVQDAMNTFGITDFVNAMLGAHRPIALFEVNFSDGKPNVSMVMGETYLPVYDPELGLYTIAYDAAHRTGFIPYRGPSGFGNFFNCYTWALRVFNDQVFVGTMDWSQLARLNGGSATNTTIPADAQAALIELYGLRVPVEGGDLVRFSEYWMTAESNAGVGNDRNYGVRNMVTDGNALYVGTANPMNLDPLGGWELIELK
jgi:hypothetical protein